MSVVSESDYSTIICVVKKVEGRGLKCYNQGMEIFKEVLSQTQQEILPNLAFLKEKGFYLAGETALALEIGHRTSLDFDFYTRKEFDAAAIYKHFQQENKTTILLNAITPQDTLLFELNDISISLFAYPYPLVRGLIKNRFFNLASPEDIAAMKIIAIIQRGIRRDFIDLYFLVKKFGLCKILGFAGEKYPGFNEYLAIQSLTYFEDADVETEDRNISIFQPFKWEDAKRFFVSEAEKIKEAWRKQDG